MFWIDIADAAGAKLGPGPIRSGIRWRYRQRLSRAGEWDLQLPLGEPKLQYATHKRHLHCYNKLRTGVTAWMGGGPLEDINVSWPSGGAQTLVLSGGDPLRMWAADTVNVAIDATTIPGSGQQVVDAIFAQMIDWTRS
jgi:hypothetical protein